MASNLTVHLGLALVAMPAFSQIFTIQVGPPAAAPTVLVSHTNDWHYRKGTNAPPTGWQTESDAALDATWAIGPGGIGYSTDTPNEVSQCRTLVPDMFNGYTTLYLRRTFEVTEPIDPTARLVLTVDYDDGFVAYLDGAEIARDRARTSVGVEPPFSDTSSSNHESSRGTSAPVNPPTNIDLGPVGSRLAAGPHVLAILGLNGAKNSSDFVMIADLKVAAESTIVAGPLAAVVKDSAVLLTGTNTIPGSTRVTINGVDATVDAGTGAWSRQQPLAPGANRLIVEAADGNGAVRFSTNQIVVSEMTTTTLSALAGHVVLEPSMGVIHVPASLTIPADGSLTIQAGTTLLLAPGVSLLAGPAARLEILGTQTAPVFLLPSDGLTMWGEIAADGADSHLTVRHAESVGGAVKGRNGAVCLLEDSFFHDYKNGSVPIGGCTSARSMTVRRCHFRVYHETLWQNTLMAIEDCLFELANNPSSDALDFDGAVEGSYLRNCTFRHGPQSNTDAVDIGPTTSGSGSTNTVIENCLMFGFPNDKGVSIGEGCYGIVVRNCLMYGNDSGVAVKDSPGGKPPCTAIVYNCTIVGNDYGFRLYNKSNPSSPTDGGQITNSYNNILWGNLETISLLNGATLEADHTDFGLTNVAGVGNFDADPLFVNAAMRDYRLSAGSPCIGSGRDGATLGATFPVGARLAPSHPVIESIRLANGEVVLGFWVDSERDYTVQVSNSASGGTWSKVADVYHQLMPRFVEISRPATPGERFYRLVSPVQP